MTNQLLSNLVKYLLEGMAVAVAAFFIPRRNVELREIVMIALTAAAVFAILDQITPEIGLSARRGAGYGIGLNQVGFGHGGQARNPARATCTCDVDAAYLKAQLENVSNASSVNTTISLKPVNSSATPVSTNTFVPSAAVAAKPVQVGTGTPMVEGFEGFGKKLF